MLAVSAVLWSSIWPETPPKLVKTSEKLVRTSEKADNPNAFGP
jgi:hypothetical protein